MMEHKIMLLVRVNVFNSTHPTKRNFSIIICFMLFAEWLRMILNKMIYDRCHMISSLCFPVKYQVVLPARSRLPKWNYKVRFLIKSMGIFSLSMNSMTRSYSSMRLTFPETVW